MGNRTLRKEYKNQLLKNGLKMETEKNQIRTQYCAIDHFPEWPMYIDIPLKKPEFWGIRISLELIPTIKQKELAGLSEAIEASSHYLEFSGTELRWCNLKNRWLYDNANGDIKDKYFDENNYYVKGKLTLGDISERQYNKLSDEAKTWFVAKEDSYWAFNRNIKSWSYVPKIPSSFLKEKQENLYIVSTRIKNGERESREKWLEMKLSQDLLEYKVWHEFKNYKHDKWWTGYKETSRKFKRKYQKEKLDWAEEANELI